MRRRNFIFSLEAKCKLNDVDRQAWLADTLTRIVIGHTNAQIDDFLPWASAQQASLRHVA